MIDHGYVCRICRAPLESVEVTCCGGEGRAILASVDAEALRTDSRIGRLVDERYQIVGAPNAGGTALVYRAVHMGLLQTVALKVLAAAPDREGALRRRFVREARLVASLRHPAVVGIQDYGVWERHPYLVMPFIEGGSLSAWVGEDEPGLGARIAAIAELLRALEAAHRLGIVHRDVKPSNVLLERDHDGTRVLLADFGLAVSSLLDTNLSRTERWVGTPLYMAPEQIAPELGALGPRTDVYSAGCVAYALLSGRTPHIGHMIPAIFYAKTQRPPERLAPVARFELPAGLALLIERAVEREPAARWPSAGAMREALLPFAGALAPEERLVHVSASLPAPRREPWVEAPPIGREALGRELCARGREALAGTGQLVVLAGAAGIGKTFLSRWWMREIASGQSARAFAVGCTRRSAPLQPIRAALLELLARRGHAGVEGLGAHLALLPGARIAPAAAARVLFPVLAETPGAALLRPDELARWLHAEASSAPLAIFVEDAERADPETVEVLGALTELLELAPAPLLVCCAARTRTAGAVAGEHQGLGRLRGDRVARVEVGPLDRAAVDRLAETLAPEAAVVVRETVWRRSNGHPLLAASLLRHFVANPAELARRPRRKAEPEAGELPADLLPMLLARVDDAAGPNETERRRMHDLLCAVAVLAVVPVSAEILDTYLDRLGWDPSVRDALLDRATDEELLADVGRGDAEQLVFSHDLVREALLATLRGRRRQAKKLHRAAAEVRGAASADEPEALSVIAHHLALAGELAESAEAFVRAARMAELLGARARADELLSEGIEHLGDAEGALRPVRARLEIARAELALRAVQLADVRAHASRALADLESSTAHMPDDALRALRLLARGGASTRESEGVVSQLRGAAERMAREGRPLDAARVLFEAAGVSLGGRDDAAAEILLKRAAELVVDRLDEDPAELDLYALLGMLPSVLE